MDYIDASKLINKERLVDTFIELAKNDSGSNEELAEKQIPSTPEQKVIAKNLAKKLSDIGLDDIQIDENYIVTATLPSNTEKITKTIGLIAHYDTSAESPNKNVNPQIHDYKGGDIVLNGGTTINADELKDFQNQNIITSDGTTLLGADDKAGIAEIIEAINVLKENSNIKHPRIRIAFTPDEETGLGVEKFNIKSFGADAAYTVDGDYPQSIESETFNAFNPEIKIYGKTVHPGYAKNKMINSIDVATWIASQLPNDEKPQTTENKQGYFHIEEIKGCVSETTLKLLVRDFDLDKAKERIAFLKDLCEQAEQKFGCKISFDEKERYHNMKEAFKDCPEVIDNAKEAIKLLGLTPIEKEIRGGTDGSTLSLNGLPTPNIGAGGFNFHSKKEFIPVSFLEKCCENIINIMQVWGNK